MIPQDLKFIDSKPRPFKRKCLKHGQNDSTIFYRTVEPCFDGLNGDFQEKDRYNSICKFETRLKMNKLSEIKTDQKSFLSF